MKPAVLILGATGTIGQGAVRAAVEASWPVVAVARDAEALQELRRRYPKARLQTLVGSVADDASADALVAALQKLSRPFAGVIAALGGGRERGRLLDQSSTQLRQTFDDAVLPHLVAARHLLPWLGGSGRNCGYVVIGGPGGRHPWAGYGHRSVAAAAVQMLARVLHGEARAFSVRLQLLEVESPVRTDANELHACEQWPCVDAIGRKALTLLEHRNDARCTGAVIDYRSNACQAATGRADVDFAGHGSSDLKDDLTLEQRETPQLHPSVEISGIEAQEMDSSASLLPARCLQDVRKLLETFTPTTKKNQERTR
ncbi:MAG TPA: SDR family NAD(P)-dependent oxidoreductase [Lysobacter sp.]|jgi:NADP-dependent 3-hydroxy acid dehydrogenase YdfG|nr:SDR family NAD(P)-dependent oxidoreductase [Lysobacter sp.]